MLTISFWYLNWCTDCKGQLQLCLPLIQITQTLAQQHLIGEENKAHDLYCFLDNAIQNYLSVFGQTLGKTKYMRGHAAPSTSARASGPFRWPLHGSRLVHARDRSQCKSRGFASSSSEAPVSTPLPHHVLLYQVGISQKQALLSRECAPSTYLGSQRKRDPSLPLQEPAALRTWGGTGRSPGGSQHCEVSRPDAARSWQEFVPVFQSKQHLPSIPQTNYYSTFSF